MSNFGISAFDPGLRISSELSELESSSPRQAGRTPRTLVKHGTFSVVLVSLSSGSRVHGHKVSGPISIQSLTGHIRVRLPDGGIDLMAGELITLAGGVIHDVEAIENSAYLLTLARSREHVV